jgi:hypothetical protein
MTVQPTTSHRQPDSLADVLERVLDKGVVIAGDIVVNVLDIELLSLKLRLFIASAQTAKELGMDWWVHDPFFTSGSRQVEDGRRGDDQVGDGQRTAVDREDAGEVEALRERVGVLENLLEQQGITEHPS